MPFASCLDLLARSNARRLAQLAIPADHAMVPEAAMRVAIEGGNLGAFTEPEREAIALGLVAIDKALADADALILSYGIPETVQTTLLARLASTVALYYLQGAERMTDDVAKAYGSVIDILRAHARGDLDLIPADPDAPPPGDESAMIASNPKRYGAAAENEVGL